MTNNQTSQDATCSYYRFQTGRHYSGFGHRVTVVVDHKTGWVYFADLDRMVSGIVPEFFGLSDLAAQSWPLHSDAASYLFSEIMRKYDRGDYTMSCVSDHLLEAEIRRSELHEFPLLASYWQRQIAA